MDKQNQSDIAAFPELFDGLEQFIDEQASELKKAGAWLSASALGGGMLLYFVISKLA
ncbi:MAG: hypothetical protein H6R14_1978 [Proteobacteria bacterium]|nr:hypothetical protein [Pseudomonadota bacterium]